MWELLEGLGKENREKVAWSINEQVIQTGIGKGKPFEYSLEGISSTEAVFREHEAIDLVFSKGTDEEIMSALQTNNVPIRIREMQELVKSGYEFTFDDVNNSFILDLP
jgi:hypothetical protein